MTREELMNEILADPGNALFGLPLSEIQRMVYEKQSGGQDPYEICRLRRRISLLEKALLLCANAYNKTLSEYDADDTTVDFWIRRADEFGKRPDNGQPRGDSDDLTIWPAWLKEKK